MSVYLSEMVIREGIRDGGNTIQEANKEWGEKGNNQAVVGQKRQRVQGYSQGGGGRGGGGGEAMVERKE